MTEWQEDIEIFGKEELLDLGLPGMPIGYWQVAEELNCSLLELVPDPILQFGLTVFRHS